MSLTDGSALKASVRGAEGCSWCMSVRPRLINPPCHSASDSHSSRSAFSREMFCALDNSVRQIKRGSPKASTRLGPTLRWLFSTVLYLSLCDRDAVSPSKAQAAAAVAAAQWLYSDRLKDEHVLNEAANEFCSFVAVFFLLARVRTTIQPFSWKSPDFSPVVWLKRLPPYYMVIINILFLHACSWNVTCKSHYSYPMVGWRRKEK